MKKKNSNDGPSSLTKRRPKSPTSPTTSPMKRKPKSRRPTPSPNKRLKGVEVEPMMYITQNEECTYKGDGIFEDDINWMKGVNHLGLKAVEDKIYDQGVYKVCYAWGAGKGTEAALALAGEEVKPVSIRDIVDRTCPTAVEEGNVASALQFIKQHGVSKESDYPPYNYEELTQRSDPLPPRGENLYKIDDWQPVDDNEDAMLEALRDHVLIVSVLQFEAFVHLQGECLLDMAEAEKRHKLKPKKSDESDESQESQESQESDKSDKSDKNDEVGGHTLLLVAAGTFTPSDEKVKKKFGSIKYWKLKNQWDKTWGFEGLGYLIRNSSIQKLRKGLRETRYTGEILKTEYLPYYAFVDGKNLTKPPDYVSKHTKRDFSVNDLIRWIELREFQKNTLIYLFYDSEYCQVNNIKVDEEFTALEKTYHHTRSDVILAKVNLLEHESASARFKFGDEEKLVLLVFLPEECRSMEYARKYEGNLNLADIVLWLGGELSAGSLIGVN